MICLIIHLRLVLQHFHNPYISIANMIKFQQSILQQLKFCFIIHFIVFKNVLNSDLLKCISCFYH